MKIGELAHASGTPVETIRFYEREGLLSTPERTEGNYRIYTKAHADRLGFIRQCRNLDMTLDEVRVLLHFKGAPQADCGVRSRRADRAAPGRAPAGRQSWPLPAVWTPVRINPPGSACLRPSR